MHAESGIHDRDTEVGSLLSTEPSQSAENDAPSSGGMPALISTASEAEIIAPTQTAAPGEPVPSSRAALVPPPRGG